MFVDDTDGTFSRARRRRGARTSRLQHGGRLKTPSGNARWVVSLVENVSEDEMRRLGTRVHAEATGE
ncbi:MULTISPECIES: hypothetical protein [unclassified Streptomyces]|uniref:hypothetical protein n=1 Tax=unclassified Streptomyces TaxID=2593676 RepID=UPI0037FD70CA